MQRRRIGGPDGIEVSALCLGALQLGTYTDEKTSFAVLDRFVEAGGSLIDTSNNYCFWEPGCTGDENENLIGRWLASRGARDRVRIATKAGARPLRPGGTLEDAEGLSAPAIRKAMEGSLRRLGTDHVDLYYTHIEDRSVPVEETTGALDELVRAGRTRLLGVSNHATWRIEQARAAARAAGGTPYTCVQQRYSYLQPRFDVPLPQAGHTHATGELLDYVAAEPDLTLLAYNTLLSGAYTRADKEIPAAYDHPGTPARLAALRAVAGELGATVNQVVLAWLTGRTPAVLPIVGVSSVAQLDEAIEAMDLTLGEEQRARLDTAGTVPGDG
ncbi:aldo/keto reductase [Streptomyces aidingensis]|uniref:Predicted oxidoreductase n=1 Tax=Streptomyces aidingensis TaxID=910347 RepID=A0A1I1E215_9ACTN|nr:aldo/keto reductase [Streptomyces aidingensis]SFB80716.1 Predicted oxidoreductase [Streptomyces aidingensis]